MKIKLFIDCIIDILSLISTIVLGIYIEFLAILYGIDWLALIIIMGIIIGISFFEYIALTSIFESKVHKNNLYNLYERELKLYKRET